MIQARRSLVRRPGGARARPLLSRDQDLIETLRWPATGARARDSRPKLTAAGALRPSSLWLGPGARPAPTLISRLPLAAARVSMRDILSPCWCVHACAPAFKYYLLEMLETMQEPNVLRSPL